MIDIQNEFKREQFQKNIESLVKFFRKTVDTIFHFKKKLTIVNNYNNALKKMCVMTNQFK